MVILNISVGASVHDCGTTVRYSTIYYSSHMCFIAWFISGKHTPSVSHCIKCFTFPLTVKTLQNWPSVKWYERRILQMKVLSLWLNVTDAAQLTLISYNTILMYCELFRNKKCFRWCACTLIWMFEAYQKFELFWD